MINTILTGVALLAATALAGPGSAIVINSCSYDVHISNTPAAGGGYNAINQVLSSGGSYSQVYTELTNGNGWSIKLSPTGNFASNLMQYEYTYHNDGTIWYDLSEVDGNPWDGNWEITATSGCTPRQAAYQYSTDDAYGMQACPDSASITVTLCSGTSAGSTSWGTTSPSVAPAPTTKKHHHKSHNTWAVENKVVESPAPTPSPSTMITTSSAAWDGPAVTVTNLAYETVTEIVTAAAPHKRHVHHRHQHA